MDSEEPAADGVGSPVTCVAELKLSEVIAEVEYRKSYDVAVPLEPSSPGAVHDTVMALFDGLERARPETAAGAVVSGDV